MPQLNVAGFSDFELDLGCLGVGAGAKGRESAMEIAPAVETPSATHTDSTLSCFYVPPPAPVQAPSYTQAA